MLTHPYGRKYGNLTSSFATTLKIDRSKPFDLATFARQNGQNYDEWVMCEEDQRSITLTEIDLAKIHLVDMLTESDNRRSTVVERIRRLKTSPYFRADAKIFEALWGQKELMEGWKWDEGYSGHIGFEGTVFRRRHDDPDELGVINIIFMGGDEGWSWHIHRLKEDGCVFPTHPSVIVEI